MLRQSLLFCGCVLVALTPVQAQQSGASNADGTILSQTRCVFAPYEEQSKFTKRFYSKKEYESAKSDSSSECFRIIYTSDGLRVVGYLVRPRDRARAPFPVIIYNRGGFLEHGKIENWNIVDFDYLSSQGFVVLASQYRGNDGGEGHDEVGGAELDDVANLCKLADKLGYADSKNVFMYGLSRGGMMTFLEMKNGVSMNAAVVVGAVYDVEAFGQRAPAVLEEATKLMPDYPSKGAAALRERSVMNWPEKVNVPLMMLHGGDDNEVPAAEALSFATKLSNLRKPYELVIYANDVHEVANNRKDRDAMIVSWFKRYLR